jgi:hypothetical protein
VRKQAKKYYINNSCNYATARKYITYNINNCNYTTAKKHIAYNINNPPRELKGRGPEKGKIERKRRSGAGGRGK